MKYKVFNDESLRNLISRINKEGNLEIIGFSNADYSGFTAVCIEENEDKLICRKDKFCHHCGGVLS
jgi:hypothetical protein